MRDTRIVEQELRLLAAVRDVAKGYGADPSMVLVDGLLDEILTAAGPARTEQWVLRGGP